ncbi:Aste57867_24931 [Aphanomyces stellatus]|uniref:Aste57867_24931 protein n=1 Tax=Aphanomyces stellatus TaxID=120398 RepID=A0A485LRT8_9STRA|nr:hypothetical protein As57867_024853 [Aphanomyces stellatus]VFU01563.1 Aste57867_24931 [Aphanomyces stellatus]
MMIVTSISFVRYCSFLRGLGYSFALKLRVNLRETGVSVHVDSNNNVSDLKERVIAAKDAILQCQLFLVVLSSESILTPLVSDQLAFAEDKGKRIIPICLHTKIDGIEKLNGVFNDRILVFADDMGFEHGMDSLVEILDEVENEFLENTEMYDE